MLDFRDKGVLIFISEERKSFCFDIERKKLNTLIDKKIFLPFFDIGSILTVGTFSLAKTLSLCGCLKNFSDDFIAKSEAIILLD